MARPAPRLRPLPPATGRRMLAVPRIEQPDLLTCGPTCLLQVYRYWRDPRPIDDLLAVNRRTPNGGTLAVYLGLTALAHGYRVRVTPVGTRVFDPTWRRLSRRDLRAKLSARADALAADPRRRASDVAWAETHAWVELLDAGGDVRMAELTPALIQASLDGGRPVLAGLNATWLYRQAREKPDGSADDDIGGEPVGHFVVVCGYDHGGARFHVRDPSSHVPFSRRGRYRIPAVRLLGAILLGDVTRDAVLLEVGPRR